MIKMDSKRFSYLAASVLFSVNAFAGAMGDVHHEPSPFVIGVEGGVVNVEWAKYGSIGGNNGNKNNSITNNSYSNLQSVYTSAFSGVGGAFLGHSFPVLRQLELIPTIGYLYVGKTSTQLNYTHTDKTTTLVTYGNVYYSNQLNVVDLTIQGNYTLDNGINFFLQPGVAILMNSYQWLASDLNFGDTDKDTNTSFRPEIALGIGKMLTQHINLFAKYRYIDGNDLNFAEPTLAPNVNVISVGLSYKG